jgi:phosphatidylglycerol---prolipoprotein diacylglyceryl transferase
LERIPIMQLQSYFAAIHWDPNPDIFLIPYLNHPLKWYGLLFVSGLIAGFFILIPLIKQRLQRTPSLKERDIADWKQLTQTLLQAANNPKDPLYSPISHLDKNTKSQLQKNTELSENSKIAILIELSKIPRAELEERLPGILIPINHLAYGYVDGLMWWIVCGTILGARLGHVFFYDWPRYQDNLIDIFKIWEGGLASHGGTLGVLLAAYGYTRWTSSRFPEIRFLDLTDLLCIPTAFAVIFIRLGNFVNQEILGTPTSASWSVIFGHPADGSLPIPRHAVQLYEALAYFLTFLLLSLLWKYKKGLWPQGFITGLFFVCVFGSRFFLEYFKAPQESVLNETYLQAGQILSIPFILFGLTLMLFSKLRKNYGISCKQS